jgi:hypothetical protein
MRDVEQASLLARVKMLLQHAERIGDRHVPAGEAAEAGVRRLVQRLQRQLEKGFVSGRGHHSSRAAQIGRFTRQSTPLCRKPERLGTPKAGDPYTFGAGRPSPRLSRASSPGDGSFA